MKKSSEDESVTFSAYGRNGHSADQCWSEDPDKAPKHLREYFTRKKARGGGVAPPEGSRGRNPIKSLRLVE